MSDGTTPLSKSYSATMTESFKGKANPITDRGGPCG
jgi:hypothetical protein